MPRDLLATTEPRDLLAGKGEEPRDLLTTKPSSFLRETYVKPIETYLKEGQSAMKLFAVRPDVALGLSKEISPEQLSMADESWSNIIRKSYPDFFKYPEKLPEFLRYAAQYSKESLANVAGEILDIGTRPSSFVAMGIAERVIPQAAMGVFRKLPKKVQQSLLKERYLWGKHPLEMAYKEMGLKPGAGKEAVAAAHREAAMKWHPDRAPAGQSLRYTREFIKKQGAYERIVEGTTIKRGAEAIPKGVVAVEPTPTAAAPISEAMALKTYTPAEFHSLPTATQSLVLAEKLKGAKSATHAASIREKYVVVEPIGEGKVDPFEFQDTHQEEIIHAPWAKGNSYRYNLEGSGDIFRELTKDSPDFRYISEKIRRIRAYVTDVKSGKHPVTGIHPEDSFKYAFDNNKDKFDALSSAWKKQPISTQVQQSAKELNLAMLSNDMEKVDSLLTSIEGEFRKPTPAVEMVSEKVIRNVEPEPSEFKCPLTTTDTPSSDTIKTTSPSPQPTKVEKPKPITTWSVNDFPDNALINKTDPDTARTIDSINGRIRNGMLRTVEDYKKGKNPYTLNHLVDTPIAFQRLEERTGFPLYTKYGVEGSKARNTIAYEVSTVINKFTEGLKKGYQTAGSTERIVNYIVKREGRLTNEERRIAVKLQDVFRDTKDIVSYLRMRRYIDGAEQVPKDLEKVVEEGEKVFVEGGRVALEKWVKGKEIGVVADDRYFPAQLLRKFRTHYSSDPFEVFNPHLRSREATEQIYDYSQSIVQKLHSYLTRMYSDYYLYDLLMDAKNDFSGTSMPFETISSLKKWLVAIQGKGVEVGWWGKTARKARGQFFKVTLADPRKWVRNYLQRYYMTLQNYPTLQHAMRTKQYFTYKLTDPELDFFHRHVSQLRELEREQLYIYEKIFEGGPIGRVDDLAIALAKRYTIIDEGNRYTTFRYALASNDKYIKLYKEGKLSLRGMLNKTGASSFYDLEVKHLLSLPIGEARLELAKLLVEKTQLRYKKTERGLSALSEAGEIATSLLQYPKGIITRYLDSIDMIARGDSMEERWAGVRLLVGLILLANVSQNVLEQITGESRYYDPDLNREVSHDPYGLIGVIGSLGIAGAQPAHVITLGRTVKRISDLLFLEATKTVPSDSYRMTAIRAILKDADQLGEAYIPFLKIVMNGVEAVEGTRSHKLLTTYFDQKTRRQTALRRNKIQRNWVEAWQHFIFGRERKGKAKEGGLWQ